MRRVGFVGWRGMVGSVLLQRMREERDFELIDPVFFTTSKAGGQGPDVGRGTAALKDARSVDELKSLDVVVTCQGGDYTNEIHPAASRGRLERLLDRRRLDAAHERGRGDRPRPGEPRGDRARPRTRA